MNLRHYINDHFVTESYFWHAPEVSAENAEKKNRIRRGLYQDKGKVFHADAVGAYNIMRKYHAVSRKKRNYKYLLERGE